MGFCKQVYWSGLPAPSPGDFPDPRIEPLSPVLAGRFFTTKPPGKPIWLWVVVVIQSPYGYGCSLFSLPVMSNSSWPHGLQHTRLSCPSPSLGVCSNSCPWSQWCHPTISSSVIPFSSCPQSLPASQSFPMSQLFAWGGQSTGVSALASFLPKNSQGWSP